jgi:hypothetical protein
MYKGGWFRTGSRCSLGFFFRSKHGGALPITPDTADDLNLKYRLDYDRLSEALVRHTLDGIRLEDARHAIYDHDLRDGTPISPAAFREFAQAENNWREGLSELAGCVRFVASLSKIDGLILMTPDFRLLAFGVEILGASEVEKVSIAENESATHLREKKANHFGTRHRSMMRYCCIHSNALGFVVSKHSRTERVRSGSLKTGDCPHCENFAEQVN